ncbi:uncharacterized protein LOC135222677 isoform X2 [Macrobrachium nipponense]
MMFLSMVSLISIIALLLTVNVILGYEVQDIFIVQCIFFTVLWVIVPTIPLLCIGTLCRETEAKLFKFCILTFIVTPIFTDIRIIMEENVIHSSKFLLKSIEGLRKSQEAHADIGSEINNVQDCFIEQEGYILEHLLMKTEAFRKAFDDNPYKQRQLESIDIMCKNFTDDLVGLCVSGFDGAGKWVNAEYAALNRFAGNMAVKVGRKMVCSEVREEAEENDPCKRYAEDKDKVEAFAKEREKYEANKEADSSEPPLEVKTKGGNVLGINEKFFKDVRSLLKKSLSFADNIPSVLESLKFFFIEFQLTLLILITCSSVIQFKTDRSYRNVFITPTVEDLNEALALRLLPPHIDDGFLFGRDYIRILSFFDGSILVTVALYLIKLVLDANVRNLKGDFGQDDTQTMSYIFFIHLFFLIFGKTFLGNLDIIIMEELDENMKMERAKYVLSVIGKNRRERELRQASLVLKCNMCERKVYKHKWCPDKMCRNFLCLDCQCH